MVTVSSPGKIHFMGEHAVVHGKPALLAAVNLRLFVTITPGDDGVVINIDEPDAQDFVRYAIELVQKELRLGTFPSCSISVSSQIPFGYHLGSSAALAVATVGAAMFFSKKLWNPQEINRIAYEVEKKQHGNPSGGDNTSVTFGGFLWYRRELEFLKSIWQLPLRLPTSLNHFLLINTGKPLETTGEMVAMVGSNVKKYPSRLEKIFTENERCTRLIAAAIKDGDGDMVLEALRRGEKTLEDMGVVSKQVQPCIREIEKSGGSVKILGGGGKKGPVGFMLCYHKDKQIVQHIAKDYGYTTQEVTLGEEGVRLESGKIGVE